MELEKIKAIIAEVLNIDADSITEDTTFVDDLGADSLDIFQIIMGIEEEFEIEIDNEEAEKIVTVADAGKCKMYMKNFGEFFNNQVENAGTIVMSRTQKMSEDKLDAAVKMLKEKNPKATIITTPWDELKGEQILAAMEHQDLILKEEMEQVVSYSVPLTAEVGTGKTWLEAH